MMAVVLLARIFLLAVVLLARISEYAEHLVTCIELGARSCH
jgi:hypothetical protein